ncbi:MAG: hypothetical protein QOE54_7144 [Streptosporangiaceae bacterium]|jgi:hypothetical protein|nr:hypothetical protein [Streptosporangiaceae bacterium]MDX6434778.1 hypothetical protein [Streptosporangiaceae bacterium]
MASAQSPQHPPGSAGRDRPFVEPLLGVGPEADQGYLASLRSGPRTMLRQLRATMLTLVIAPLAISAIVPFVVRDGKSRFGDLPGWVFLPLVLAFLVALVVGLRAPRALPLAPDREADPRRTAELAAVVFRQALFLRFALSDAVILLGLALAVIGHSEMPFAVGFVLGYPLLIALALPTKGTVERMRRRMEAAGTESHLWAVLLAPLPAPADFDSAAAAGGG